MPVRYPEYPEYQVKISSANVRRVRRLLADIKTQRKRSGCNQRDFWRRFGLTQSGGSRYERGRTLPRCVQILLALEALGDVEEAQMIEVARLIELVDLSEA